MNFIKLTRVLNPYDVRIGYYGSMTYISSQNVPSGQVYGISAAASSPGFFGGLGSLVGLGQQSQLSSSQQAGQALSQLSQQQLYSAGQNQTSPQYSSPPTETQDLYIPVDSINYMIGVKNYNYSTSLLLINNNDPFFIKETPEQIMKMMHDSGFNKKMDEILSE